MYYLYYLPREMTIEKWGCEGETIDRFTAVGEMIDSFWLLLYNGDVIFKSTDEIKIYLMAKSIWGWRLCRI